MRPAHPLSLFVVAGCTAAALTNLAHAQAPAARPLATDPAAATAPLHHAPLRASGSVEAVGTNWRSANEAVAAFPRGHMDLLEWEAKQAQGTGAVGAAGAMPHGAHQHAPVGAKP